MYILHQCIFYINVYFNVKKFNQSSKNCSKFIQVPILVEKSKNYTIPKTKMQLLEEWLNNVGGEVTARNVGWMLLTFLILLEAMFNFIHVLFCSMVKWLTSIVRQFLDLNTILRQLYVNSTSIVRQFHVNLTSIVRQFPTFAFFAAVNFTSIIRQLHVNYTSISRQLFFWSQIGAKLTPIWSQSASLGDVEKEDKTFFNLCSRFGREADPDLFRILQSFGEKGRNRLEIDVRSPDRCQQVRRK